MNSDTVTYRAVVTATKTGLNRPDSYYDQCVDSYNVHYAGQPHLQDWIKRTRDQQAEDHNSIGKVQTWTFGDHKSAATVKAQITKDMRDRAAWRIDKTEWFISETKWKPVDV